MTSEASTSALSEPPVLAAEVEVVSTTTRKRLRNEGSWTRNVRRNKRAKGEGYVGGTGKVVPDRISQATCSCKRKCCEKVGSEAIESLFSGFYRLESKDKQDAYLFSLITNSPVARQRPRTTTATPRSASFYYRVKTATGDVVVCKQAFVSIFGITVGRVRRLCEWTTSGQLTPPTDKRGKHGNHYKIPEEIHTQVCNHIESFPPRESHYSRHDNTNKRFLSENLNIMRMYMLYLEKHEPEQVERIEAKVPFTGVVKEHYYR